MAQSTRVFDHHNGAVIEAKGARLQADRLRAYVGLIPAWRAEYFDRAGELAQCGSSLRPRGASGLPAGCCEQAPPTTPAWSWISVSSSLREGYDEPEILRSSSH
jgi:hypothetical protein